MEPFRYFLLLTISYLGLAAGRVISHFAKEELIPGRRYFIIIRSMVFSAVLLCFLLYLKQILIIVLPVALLLGFFSYLAEQKTDTGFFYYSFFAISLFETSSGSYAPIVAILIFVFGLATASIKTEKTVFRLLLDNIIYILLASLLFFIL